MSTYEQRVAAYVRAILDRDGISADDLGGLAAPRMAGSAAAKERRRRRSLSARDLDVV